MIQDDSVARLDLHCNLLGTKAEESLRSALGDCVLLE